MTLREILPPFEWIGTYKRDYVRGDLIGGVTLAVMLVPQAMAYAMLAGLPPVMGLYAATVPLLIYALFGSSRHLSVGPVAVISLLVAGACGKLAQPGSVDYREMVLLLALMVGIIQVLLGSFRMGFLFNFISHAVISGFTSAAAIIIICSQIKNMLGITITGDTVISILVETTQHAGSTNVLTLGISAASIVTLLFFKKKMPLFPAPLLVVVAGTLAVYSLGLGAMGVRTVGTVPAGIPPLSLPAFRFEIINALFPAALVIFFVGFMESIAVAKMVAVKRGYMIDADQELRGLGAANMASAFFSGYPVTGGFSRTAINHEAGTQTGLASVMTGVLVLLTLLFLTPLFTHLPNAVLASVIVVAVSGLITPRDAIEFFKVKKSDGWTWVLTFAATLILGPEHGILIGFLFSLAVFIARSAYPHCAELGYIETWDVFRNVARYPDAATFPRTLIMRIDGPLYFANIKFIEERLHEAVLQKEDLQWIVIDCADVYDIDGVAVHSLDMIMREYADQQIGVVLTGVIGPVRDLLKRAGWDRKYGDRIAFFSIKNALTSLNIID